MPERVREAYAGYLQEAIDEVLGNSVTVSDVIGSLYVETGNVEASFSSKGSNVLS